MEQYITVGISLSLHTNIPLFSIKSLCILKLIDNKLWIEILQSFYAILRLLIYDFKASRVIITNALRINTYINFTFIILKYKEKSHALINIQFKHLPPKVSFDLFPSNSDRNLEALQINAQYFIQTYQFSLISKNRMNLRKKFQHF